DCFCSVPHNTGSRVAWRWVGLGRRRRRPSRWSVNRWRDRRVILRLRLRLPGLWLWLWLPSLWLWVWVSGLLLWLLDPLRLPGLWLWNRLQLSSLRLWLSHRLQVRVSPRPTPSLCHRCWCPALSSSVLMPDALARGASTTEPLNLDWRNQPRQRGFFLLTRRSK